MALKLDMNKIKQKQLETTNSTGQYMKLKEGKNFIRVFPFSHKVTKDDVSNKLFRSEQIGQDVVELDRAVALHFNFRADKKPVISTKATMEEYFRYKSSPNSADQQRAKDIRPNTKFFINVVDMENVDKGMLILGAPKTVYHAITNIICDDEFGENVLGSQGRDFIVTYTPKNEGTDKYHVVLRDKEKSAKLPSDSDGAAVDLYSQEAYVSMGHHETEDEPVKSEPKSNTMQNNGLAADVQAEVEAIFREKDEGSVTEPKTAKAFGKKK
jgi:hypothetical protein